MYARANAAGITFSTDTPSSMASFNYKPVVTLNVAQKNGANEFVFPGQVVASNNNANHQPIGLSSPSEAVVLVKPSSPLQSNGAQKMQQANIEKEEIERTIDEETMAKYKLAFRMFDRNDDGRITAQELGTAMKSLGHLPTEDELLSMVKEVDEDGNGTIEFNEFLQMMARRINNPDEDQDLSDTFRVFDRDKDGYITAQELKMVMASLGEQLTDAEIRDMINAADRDGDGKVNYEEFKTIWQSSNK